MKYTHDIVILGGGAAGLVCASGCAQLGMKTALIEQSKMGGDCLHYGCVPSKTLLSQASQFAIAQRNTSQPNQPSAKTIFSTIDSVITTIEAHDSKERFEKLGAEVYFGNAQFLDKHSLKLETADGRVDLSAKSIVIATGSAPKTPPIPGLADVSYITNKNVFSLDTIPKRLVIIGGGPIGIEMAQAFTELGSSVVVIEAFDQILIHEDPDIASALQKTLIDQGIRILTGVSIEKITEQGSKKSIHISNGSPIECDTLLVAAGRKGNIDRLNLDAAGVKHERGFITVDKKLRTSQKHIMAIGDVNGAYLFTHVAGAEGALAVRRLALHAGGSMNYARVPWVTYTHPEIASVGYNEKRAQKANIPHEVHIQNIETVDRAHTEQMPEGYLKILCHKKTKKIIGGQVIGAHAGELLTPLLFAVHHEWKIPDFRIMYPYPVLSEIYGKIASAYLQPYLFNDRTRNILRFLFRYRGKGPKKT